MYVEVNNDDDWISEIFETADWDRDGVLTWDEAARMDEMTKTAVATSVHSMTEQLRNVYDFRGDKVGSVAVLKFVTSIVNNVEDDDHETPLDALMNTTAEYMELVASEHKKLDPRIGEWFRRIYRMADIDKSGGLDFGEVEFLRIIASQVFAADEDDDDVGVLDNDAVGSRPEEIGAAADLLQDFDANGDGVVDKLEFMGAAIEADPSGHTMQRAGDLFAKADANRDGRLDMAEVESLLAHIGGL